jgi:hypothetical protein
MDEQKEYESHWFVKSLQWVPERIKRHRQIRSCDGQLSLPITPGEADRRKRKKRKQKKAKGETC